MKYDFDSIVERKHTHSTKWLKFSDPNIIPMWIADMDFACPKEITDPMRERVDQGIFGSVSYTHLTLPTKRIV